MIVVAFRDAADISPIRRLRRGFGRVGRDLKARDTSWIDFFPQTRDTEWWFHGGVTLENLIGASSLSNFIDDE